MSDLNAVIDQMPPEPLRGNLRKLRKKKGDVPSSVDPMVELRRLTKQHNTWTKKSVAIMAMSSDRKNRETGETIVCDLPDDVRVQMHDVAKALNRQSAALKSSMHRELKKIAIYTQYLEGLFGIGPIIAAYLVTGLDPRIKERTGGSTKSSAWRMRCGLAVIDGHLVRRSKGNVNTYSSELRTRIFQLFQAMWKNQGHDPSNKYIRIWKDYVTRIQNSERVFDRSVDKFGVWTGKILNAQGKPVSARGFAHSGGWHKAADVFIEDLYIVWRALEGLPVWPSYHSAKLGYGHGGKIVVNEPKMLTLAEALACVEYVDRRKELDLSEEIEEDFDTAAEE